MTYLQTLIKKFLFKTHTQKQKKHNTNEKNRGKNSLKTKQKNVIKRNRNLKHTRTQ